MHCTSATIRLGTDSDSAAVQEAIDSSTRGGIKAASLAGSLFNHSDDKKTVAQDAPANLGPKNRGHYSINITRKESMENLPKVNN